MSSTSEIYDKIRENNFKRKQLEASIELIDCSDNKGEPPTNSKRVSKPVQRFVDETFVKGSRFKGCDHYDHKF